jgi:predicted DNA-binding transcriptional regulator YafY
MPQRLRRRVAALQSFILPLAAKGPSVDAKLLSALAAACRDCEALRFRYLSRDGTATERHAEPHRLVLTNRRWYLAAWDTDREAWRTFRVDRIDPKLKPGPRFIPRDPPDGDFAAYVARSVVYRNTLYTARVILHASIEAASERLPPGAGVLEPCDSETCVLTTGASSLDTLAVYLALVGFEFRVEHPPELSEKVRHLASRFGRAAE